jgi:hypothetical protein
VGGGGGNWKEMVTCFKVLSRRLCTGTEGLGGGNRCRNLNRFIVYGT